MQEKFVKINGQSSYLGIPNKRNGFGIIFLGGTMSFVADDSSDWHENPNKKALFKFLLNQGYVIGYSNAHGQNWGSANALEDIVGLHRRMIEETMIDSSIHLFAINIGGILALRLMRERVIPIRSIAFSQPVLNMQGQREYENKLIQANQLDMEQDPIGRAIAKAHKISLEKIDDYLNELDLLQFPLPDYNCKIWYGAGDQNVPVDKNSLYFIKLRNEQGLQTAFEIQSCISNDKENICCSDHYGIARFYREYEGIEHSN